MLTWVFKDSSKSADYGTFVICSIFKAWPIELRPKIGLFLDSNEISLRINRFWPLTFLRLQSLLILCSTTNFLTHQVIF